MLTDFVLIPWHIEDQPYTVKVEMPTYSSGSVVEIYAASGERISVLDWEAHGFDSFQLELCALRAINEESRKC